MSINLDDLPPELASSGPKDETFDESYLPAPIIERDPIITGLMSIIPGAGHIYIGRTMQGLSYFGLVVIMLLLMWWVEVTAEFEAFDGLMTALVICLALFWAWQAATAANKASKKEGFIPALGMVSVLLFTYLIGWQATEVNMEKFLTEFPDTFRIFTLIVWPWEEAVERDEELLIVDTRWETPCAGGSGPQQSTAGEQYIAVEPACGDLATYSFEEGGLVPGTEVTIMGAGFDPDKTIELWWENPIGDPSRPQVVPEFEEGREFFPEGAEEPEPDETRRLRFYPNNEGAFEVTFTAPQTFLPSDVEGSQTFTFQAQQVAAVGDARVSDDFQLAVDRMIVTIFQALMATSFGIIFAIPFSFLAARNLMYDRLFTRIIYFAARFIMNVTRSIEPIIWGVIAVVWVGLGPFAGVMALMIHTIAALGKLYSESIESIEDGPIEAITATGATRLQTILYAIVPQIVPPYLSFTLYRWDINVRMSTIIGFVGGGGIGQVLFQWINQSRWSSAGMAVWLIAITVSVLDYASSELRKRFI